MRSGANAAPPGVAVTGGTRVAAVIGHPVSHSRSPAIHNAAFAAVGLDWVFTAFDVPDGSAGHAVAAMRSLGLAGMSVTMPHKAAVVGHLDDLSSSAVALDAVNCIAWDGEVLVGHNTDGAGLIASLRSDGVDPGGASVVMLGAGGAARAAVPALAEAGAARVMVWNRSSERARAAARLCDVGEVLEGPSDGPGMRQAIESADILVNATPVGMREDDGSPIPGGFLHSGLYVSELIYHPDRTRLMEDARRAGAATANGIGMLVGQAAEAFRLWTGIAAPLDAMEAAATRRG